MSQISFHAFTSSSHIYIWHPVNSETVKFANATALLDQTQVIPVTLVCAIPIDRSCLWLCMMDAIL